MRAVFRWQDERGPQVREVEAINGRAEVPADAFGHGATIEWVAPPKPPPRIGVEWARGSGYECGPCGAARKRVAATWERAVWMATSGGTAALCDACAQRTAEENGETWVLDTLMRALAPVPQ